jgi:hypothetical protein
VGTKIDSYNLSDRHVHRMVVNEGVSRGSLAQGVSHDFFSCGEAHTEVRIKKLRDRVLCGLVKSSGYETKTRKKERQSHELF